MANKAVVVTKPKNASIEVGRAFVIFSEVCLWGKLPVSAKTEITVDGNKVRISSVDTKEVNKVATWLRHKFSGHIL